MASTPPEPTIHVLPAPGITIYGGGKHAPFEPGRPVPLPQSHAEELIAKGLAVRKLTHAEQAAHDNAEAAAAAAQATAAEAESAASAAEAAAKEAAAAVHP